MTAAQDPRGYFAHETAVVDPPCEIGAGTKIWHFSHVMRDSRIGARCNIGQNVVVSPQCVIGDNVKIQNNVSVYTGVIIEDDVFCGPSMVFTNVINPRSFIERKDEYRRTLIRRGASIGANATIVCGVTLGRYCVVGAGRRRHARRAGICGRLWQSRARPELGLLLRHRPRPRRRRRGEARSRVQGLRPPLPARGAQCRRRLNPPHASRSC